MTRASQGRKPVILYRNGLQIADLMRLHLLLIEVLQATGMRLVAMNQCTIKKRRAPLKWGFALLMHPGSRALRPVRGEAATPRPERMPRRSSRLFSPVES